MVHDERRMSQVEIEIQRIVLPGSHHQWRLQVNRHRHRQAATAPLRAHDLDLAARDSRARSAVETNFRIRAHHQRNISRITPDSNHSARICPRGNRHVAENFAELIKLY